MTERFKNAIDALVYAFFNDTLAKGTCKACAVGNICAWAYGYKKKSIYDVFEINDGLDSSNWGGAVYLGWARGMTAINKTGYDMKEIALIEKAFEDNTKIDHFHYDQHNKKQITNDQYNGLMAVVEVLCELEGIEDPKEYKELFTV